MAFRPSAAGMAPRATELSKSLNPLRILSMLLASRPPPSRMMSPSFRRLASKRPKSRRFSRFSISLAKPSDIDTPKSRPTSFITFSNSGFPKSDLKADMTGPAMAPIAGRVVARPENMDPNVVLNPVSVSCLNVFIKPARPLPLPNNC